MHPYYNGLKLECVRSDIFTLFAGSYLPGIAVDPDEDKLYYTFLDSTINMASLKTGKRKMLVRQFVGMPWAVALERKAR